MAEIWEKRHLKISVENNALLNAKKLVVLIESFISLCESIGEDYGVMKTDVLVTDLCIIAEDDGTNAYVIELLPVPAGNMFLSPPYEPNSPDKYKTQKPIN